MSDFPNESGETEVTNELRPKLHRTSSSSNMKNVPETKSNIEDLVRVILALSTVL